VSRPAVLWASAIHWEYKRCARCWWLKTRYELRSAGLIMPPIFQSIDTGMKLALSKTLPPGVDGTIEPEPRGVYSVIHERDHVAIKTGGRPDALVHHKDGGVTIIDYKASASSSESLAQDYSGQVSSYAYAMERPDHGDPRPVKGAWLGVWGPESFTEADCSIVAIGPVRWVEVPIDLKAMEQTLDEAVALLAQPKPPKRSEGCGFCLYVARYLRAAESAKGGGE
jgi:hypothetical protein